MRRYDNVVGLCGLLEMQCDAGSGRKVTACTNTFGSGILNRWRWFNHRKIEWRKSGNFIILIISKKKYYSDTEKRRY